MTMDACLMFIHVLAPLHAGTGQGVGVIDLPLAREKATGLPYLPGSSLKGVLRDACQDDEVRKRVFGPGHGEASEHAGSVSISDQRLLLLPVRSLKGTFAWVTSPFVLRRLCRDCESASIAGVPGIPSIPVPDRQEVCLVPDNENTLVLRDGRVILEDLDPSARPDPKTATWAAWLAPQVFPGDDAWQQIMRQRLCVVHDDVLGFLLGTATEVFARIRLREGAKTVEDGGLWYEEALPTESILYGLVSAIPVRASQSEVFDVLRRLVTKPLQLGGDATIGRGLCRVRMSEVG